MKPKQSNESSQGAFVCRGAKKIWIWQAVKKGFCGVPQGRGVMFSNTLTPPVHVRRTIINVDQRRCSHERTYMGKVIYLSLRLDFYYSLNDDHNYFH